MNTTTKVIIAFTAIFLIGFATGYVVNQITTTKTGQPEQNYTRGERSTTQHRDMSRDEFMERSRNRLIRHLNLTDEQQEPLFQKMGEYTGQIRQVTREQREIEQDLIQKYYNAFLKDLSELLDETQLERYNAIFHPDSVRFGRGPGMRGRTGPNPGSNDYRGSRN